MKLSLASSSSRSEVRELLEYARKVLEPHVSLDEVRCKPVPQGFASARDKIGQMAERYSEPFRLAVVGDFNVGKSAMINALLGQDLLREGVVPTTGAVTELWWSKEESGRVVGSDGSQIFEGSIKQVSCYTDQRTDEGKQVSGRGVRVILSGPFDLLRHLVIIDTPGLGASPADDKVTLEALQVADAAILALSAARPGGATAVAMAARLQSTGKRMLTVVTWADQVKKEGLEAALQEASDLFAEVSDGPPVTFSATKVRQAQQALDLDDRQSAEEARVALDRWGYTALHGRLVEDYFSSAGLAGTRRAESSLGELQHMLSQLLRQATAEHASAQEEADRLGKELSETERLVNEILRPKIPFLETKVDEIVDAEVAEFIADLTEALELFIDKVADGGIGLGLQTIWSKLSSSYEQKLRREMEDQFRATFPEEQADIMFRRIERGVQRLLEMEWDQVVADVGRVLSGDEFDPEEITRQLRDHLAEVAVAMSGQAVALIALLFIPGGPLIDLAWLVLFFIGQAKVESKEDVRIARGKREVALRVRGQRKKLADQISRQFHELNHRLAEQVIDNARRDSTTQQQERSRQVAFAERWRRAHTATDTLLDAVSEQLRGGAA